MEYTTEQIWDEFSKGLRSFIANRVSNPSHVEDIMQDVFIKIHTNIETLNEGSKIKSWVYQIARNTIIDFYRKHKIKHEDIEASPFEDEEAARTLEGFVDQKPAQEILSGLKGMVDGLPEKYAEALSLVEFEGLSQVELAKKLGISISGAKSRVQRGRQLLKDVLLSCCHIEFDRYGTVIDFRPVCCCCCRNARCE